jgi:hypothetical protein
MVMKYRNVFYPLYHWLGYQHERLDGFHYPIFRLWCFVGYKLGYDKRIIKEYEQGR